MDGPDTRAPGALLASGRDSDIFEYRPGLVLRRSREGRSMRLEAETMELARAAGYPVPAVEEISDDGSDLVMERIDGPSMMAALSRRPWLPQYGAVLADLHVRLHEIEAPGWVQPAPCGEGGSLLHFDLHPLNVLMGPKGPVVIDWSNACRGDGASDVAVTWMLLCCGSVPTARVKAAILGRGRQLLVRSFLRGFDMAPVRKQLSGVAEWKRGDPHMSQVELRAMARLAAREHPGHPMRGWRRARRLA